MTSSAELRSKSPRQCHETDRINFLGNERLRANKLLKDCVKSDIISMLYP